MKESENSLAIPEEKRKLNEAALMIRRMAEQMAGMAELVQATNARMAAMEESLRDMRATIRTLEKVTPGQAAEINKRIRERAAAIGREYQMGSVRGMYVASGGGQSWEAGPRIWQPDPEQVKELTGAIRKDVREMTGVKTAREIARCDYPAVKEFIEGWDDYDVIRRIREKGREAAWKK